ncbi:DUF4012 domain-containing protein [Candidatus Woesebacteria bacterium]|nr:DUF4012 domain-containing protein [Candidatus Woesebacteria bacterium]
MVPQLVTHLDSDAPLVVVVAAPGKLRSELVRAISEMGLHTEVSSYSDFEHSISQETLERAYKIVWVIDALQFFSREVQHIMQSLAVYSRKTVIVQPIVDSITSSRPTPFSSTWQKISELQTEIILNINGSFDESVFMFAKNLLGSSLFPLEIATIQLDKNLMYDPNIYLSFISIDAFIHQVVPLFFRPSQQSACFLGQEVPSSQLIEETTLLFSRYYQRELVVKREQLTVVDTVPFPVSEIVLEHLSSLHLVDEFVREYSSRGVSTLEHIIPKGLQEPQVVSIPTTRYEKSTVTVEPTLAEMKSEDIHPQQVAAKSTPPVFEVSREKSFKPEKKQEVELKKSKKTEKDKKSEKIETDEFFDVNQELSRIFKTPRAAEKASRIEKMAHTELKHAGKSKRKRILFYGGLGFIGAGLGVLVLVALFIGTQFFVKKQLLAVAKMTVVDSISTEDWRQLEKSTSFLEIQTTSYGQLFDLSMISDAEHLVDVTTQLINVAFVVHEMDVSVQSLYYRLVGSEDGSAFEVAQNLSSQAETTYENLSLVRAGIEQISFGEDELEKEQILKSYQEKIDEIRKELVTQRQVLPLLQDMFGGTKKTYLILFQNEQELRPTGGFIQAAAVVTFSEGKLITKQVFSSYDIDSLVSGSVAPPDDLPRFLGEENWYFRDSNWNPDFSQAAAKSSWFISKAVGGKVDGVVALTLDSTGDLIDALGPIEMPEHNEVITSKNLPALMEHHSEKLLVENSQEKDYSVLILERLIEKAVTAKPEKISAFFNAIHDNLEEKELLVSSEDTSVQELFSSLGWTGSLIKPNCPAQFTSDVCTVDAIAEVAANTGVNKANYYVTEKVQHTIELLPGVAQHTRTIQIENTADINAWPKGDYRSYYRFYLNSNAQVTEITINNKKLGKADLVERVEQGRSMVGFLVTVPIQAQTEVVLKYSIPLSGEAAYSYAFFDQKQPGADRQTSVTIVPFSGLKPAKIAPQAEVTPGGIIFDTENRKSHGFYGVEFR